MTDSQVNYISYDINVQSYDQNKIKTKNYNKNDVSYSILNYDKNILCFDDTKTGLYRSVIVSSPENKILCFSPPKSISMDTFKQKFPTIDNAIYANEIIEGTMINLFYDERISKWEISTKSAVGGTYFYYRNQYELDDDKNKQQKSFYRMFLDALRADENQELNDLPFLEYMHKGYSYSFVMQHPVNHIVLPIHEPKLYLVAVYDISITNNVKYIPPVVYESWNIFENIRGLIDFPKCYTEKQYEDIENKYCSIQQDYKTLGVMFINMETGERSSIQNPTYEEIKKLRGNNPNLQYQYLCLRRARKIKDFLYYFPQYKSLFYNFYNDYNNFIINVHNSYISYYVQKQEIKISKKYFPHIYKIHHTLFLPSLQTDTPLIIRKRVVNEYFEGLEPREMLYHLNYDKRQYSSSKENTVSMDEPSLA